MSDLEAATKETVDSMARKGVSRTCRQRCCTFLAFSRFLKATGVLSCLLVAICNLIALSDTFEALGKDGNPEEEIVSLVHLVFLILMSVLLALAFFELSLVLTPFTFLESWHGIGLTLCFLAASTLDKANTGTGYDDRVRLAVRIICYILVGVGLLFLVLGCCGGKRAAMRQAARQRELRRRRAGFSDEDDDILDL